MTDRKMEYCYLGKSGLKISKVVFGAMSIGSSKWQDWVLDEAESMKVLQAVWDAGISTIDTANIYSAGESERLIGKFLKEQKIPREQVVILTKCFNVVTPNVGDPHPSPEQMNSDLNYVNQCGLSRTAIFNAVEASLKRLDTPYIDLLQIHRSDRNVPREETMKALHDLVQSGKVRYIGASSMRAYEFCSYQFVAEKNGWTKFVSMQSQHSLMYREEEAEMFAFCKETGVGLIPWYPLNTGKLARPLDKQNTTSRSGFKGMTNLSSFEENSEADKEIINRVEEISKKRGVSMAQVAFAWSATKVDAPIVGLSKPERVQEMVEAVHLKLTDEECRYLEEPYVPKAVIGHA